MTLTLTLTLTPTLTLTLSLALTLTLTLTRARTLPSEAGVAKRLRMAGALNAHGRLLYFYG